MTIYISAVSNTSEYFATRLVRCRDCTIKIHPVLPSGTLAPPTHTLYGHSTQVTCLSLLPSVDTVVSGGSDGGVVVHTYWGGKYTRTVWGGGGSVTWCTVTSTGNIITYDIKLQTLAVYGINGELRKAHS